MLFYNFQKKILDSLYADETVKKYFKEFQRCHPGYTPLHKKDAFDYIMKLNKAYKLSKPLHLVEKPKNHLRYFNEKLVTVKRTSRGEASSKKEALAKTETLSPWFNQTERLSVEELVKKLLDYDVISFDIFDTLIYRKIEKPIDLTHILAKEIGFEDFEAIRKRCENRARENAEWTKGVREVTLSEIYDYMPAFGISKDLAKREEELEVELAVQNPYMKKVFDAVKEAGKTIVLLSDMYLDKTVLEKILHKCGYSGWDKFYLSNETLTRKGDGTSQKLLIEDYTSKKIIHIGDDFNGDYNKSIEAGIDAIHNPDSRFADREQNLRDSLAPSIYRAVINNTMNNGLWNESLYYSHGFRVGGILAVGYCQFLNRIAKNNNIDKILFCARDCEVLYKIYNQHFKQFDNDYISISRYAIMNITADRYLYDLTNRFIMRHLDQNKNRKPIKDILEETGFAYLNDYLDESGISPFIYPCSIDKKKVENFILEHKSVVVEHNKTHIEAAKKYFSDVIGDAKRVLVVDIGWSGTCISSLDYFIKTQLPDLNVSVRGALMCTNRNIVVTNQICNDNFDSYIYSPEENIDLARFMFPAKAPTQIMDKLHLPLEYLFTSTDTSIINYCLDSKNKVYMEKAAFEIPNRTEIEEMQDGMLKFAEIFADYYKVLKFNAWISPYTAITPLKYIIERKEDSYKIYKNFIYDGVFAPYAEQTQLHYFSELFENEPFAAKDTENKLAYELSSVPENKRILFVTPELIYTGAPRSLLRMCKVAKNLGYFPVVWSALPGPFVKEFDAFNIPVRIVPENEVCKQNYIDEIKMFGMAVCNTIVTDKYVIQCEQHIPTIWYIREATNIPDFIRKNAHRKFVLENSNSIYCVSDYAAKAIRKFTDKPVKVIRNAVEDEVEMAVDYKPGSGEKVKFVQFGTIEYRKGYDVLLSAYKSMPEDYKNKSELYFGGGFINSGTPYSSYLFGEMKNEPAVHYLGVVKGEKNKIENLSSKDVVVVASRDESCSLVALEGAMLSKPLIVTENTGAKYIVENDNGYIVETGNVESLKTAMMKLIDAKDKLYEMGKISRINYEKFGSMKTYEENLKDLYAMTEIKNSSDFIKSRNLSRNALYSKAKTDWEKKQAEKEADLAKATEKVIVSLTSHPGRIDTVELCIKSLLKQTSKPEKIILWLSKEQFPGKTADLPEKLTSLTKNSVFEIKFVDDDLKPHKKYYYATKEYPDLPLIIVDDDVEYDKNLIARLMTSYRVHPDCISTMRANLMTFDQQGKVRPYNFWNMGYTMLLDTPSLMLMPTGIGGVLYPPHSIPETAFDTEEIKKNCLYCDDLWLKIFTASNGYKVVVPRNYTPYKEIPGTQDVALWHLNVYGNNNDVTLQNILSYYDEKLGSSETLLKTFRKDFYC